MGGTYEERVPLDGIFVETTSAAGEQDFVLEGVGVVVDVIQRYTHQRPFLSKIKKTRERKGETHSYHSTPCSP